jgi:hypothetical protein
VYMNKREPATKGTLTMRIVINTPQQNIVPALRIYPTSFLAEGSAASLPVKNDGVPMRSPATSIILAEAVKESESRSSLNTAGEWFRDLLSTLRFVGSQLCKPLGASTLEPEG